jgi:hypothetical protein
MNEELKNRMQSEGHQIGKEDVDLSNPIFEEDKSETKEKSKDKDEKQ